MQRTQKKGFFERAMPRAGFVLNIVSSLATGVVDLISMRIVSKDAGTSIATGVIGTISGTVLNWLVFLFSNVRHDYAEIGKKIDKKIGSSDGSGEPKRAIKCCPLETSYTLIFARIGLSGAVLATSALDAVSQYTEIQSLGVSARNEGMNFTETSAIWFGLFLASTNFTAEFLTFNSFANQAIAALQAKLQAEADPLGETQTQEPTSDGVTSINRMPEDDESKSLTVYSPGYQAIR